jgi:CheY-like chemotaxis protein
MLETFASFTSYDAGRKLIRTFDIRSYQKTNEMSHSGPIVVVEDDEDDQFLIKYSLGNLKVENTIVFCNNGLQAYQYLKTTTEQPFLILCDINMPIMNGIELREKIEAEEYLKQKAIPFVFLSTSDNASLIKKAYQGTIQGFYKKAGELDRFEANLKLIIDYWRMCLHPNNVSV